MKRPALPDGEALAAAELVSPRAWGERYRAGEGPLHYASGPAKRRTLLSEADRLEHLAAAMRMVADYLPDGDDFFDVPARRATNGAPDVAAGQRGEWCGSGTDAYGID